MGQKGNIKVEIQINVHIKTHFSSTWIFENNKICFHQQSLVVLEILCMRQGMSHNILMPPTPSRPSRSTCVAVILRYS